VRVLDVEIPSDVREIEHVVDLVQRECAELAYAPRQVRLNVPVALSEALSNAILRGNGDDPEKQVRVRARVDASELVVEVEDQGGGFDLSECTANDPTLDENLENEQGRGLFLMQSLMDSVERRSAPDGGGNIVRMTLRRAS
jgi:serine/threonine-protein kinase RsbW